MRGNIDWDGLDVLSGDSYDEIVNKVGEISVDKNRRSR